MTSGDDAPVEPGETPPQDHPRQGTPPYPPQGAPQPGTPPLQPPYGPPPQPGPAAEGPRGTPWPPPQPGAYPSQGPGAPAGPQPGPYGNPGGPWPGPHPGFPPGPQPQPGPYPGAAPGGAWPGPAQSGQPGGSPAGPSPQPPQSNPYPYTPPGGQGGASSGPHGPAGTYPGPYAAPGGQGAEQQQVWQAATPPPPELWQMPTQPSAPARRRWVLPVGALVAVLLVAGGTFAFMSSRQTGTPRAAGSASAVPVAASASATPPADADVCSMLDPNETERLVPQATIDSHTRDNRGDSLVSYVTYSCSWANRNISYKDVTRSREITLDVSKYEAIGTTTAEKSARIQYNGELSFYKYRETISNKKQYYSKAREYQGIGDEAAAQYQWTRDDSWYSFGEGVGRVGDVVFKVKYQASQKKKESDPLSAEGTQSITEENALREVKSLLSQVAKSVAAWRAGKPLPYHARPKPSPTPSPSPTRIPLPPVCVRLEPLAATLVPKTEGVAVRSQEGKATVTQCQWWNDALPLGGGKVRWRNLRIAVRTFTDEDSARYYLIDQRSSAKFTAGSRIGGIRWGKIEKLAGYGQDAFGQAIRQRTDTAQSNRYEIYALDGKNVIWVLFSGSDRPENTPINASESVLMDPKEAASGAKSVAKALLDAL